MLGTRITLVRIASAIIIIIASYIVGWYVYTRFTQLSFEGWTVKEDEVNNPRLNYTLLDELEEEYGSKKVYSLGDQPQVVIEENDPFYE